MKKLPQTIASIVTVAALNLLTGLLAQSLSVPLFLDTWATTLGAIFFGPLVGGIGGIIFNLVLAIINENLAFGVWGISSLWTALITYMLWKEGWLNLKRPLRLVGAAILSGFSNTLLSFVISFVFFNEISSFSRAAYLFDTFYAYIPSVFGAAFGYLLTVNLVDRILMSFLVAAILLLVPKKFLKQAARP